MCCISPDGEAFGMSGSAVTAATQERRSGSSKAPLDHCRCGFRLAAFSFLQCAGWPIEDRPGTLDAALASGLRMDRGDVASLLQFALILSFTTPRRY